MFFHRKELMYDVKVQGAEGQAERRARHDAEAAHEPLLVKGPVPRNDSTKDRAVFIQMADARRRRAERLTRLVLLLRGCNM